MDIYNHTTKFFKPNKKTDSYAATVEVGERRIRPAVIGEEDELDQRVYGGKRVSRQEMLLRRAQESEEGSDDEEDEEIDSEEYGDEEEGEDSEEDAEDDMEDEEEDDMEDDEEE